MLVFFFFKQKTAYEMRISDWSSDVCSSDLRKEAEAAKVAAEEKKKAYQEALRKARAEVYAEQDLARRAVLDERAKLVREARARANDRVQIGRASGRERVCQ